MRTTPTNPAAAIRVPGAASPTPTGTPAGRAAQLPYLAFGDPMTFSFDLQ